MAKSKKHKPSFDAADTAGGETNAGWVYRSDAAALTPDPEPAPKTDRTTAAASAAALTAPPRAKRAAAPASAPATASQPSGPTSSDREQAARLLVDRYTKYAAAAGLVPLPIVDMAAIAGLQVTMLSALSALYGVPFSRERGRAIVAALLGGAMPTLAGHQILASIAKRLTVIGTVIGMVSVSGFAVAATHAVGRVFIAHFESGGTLLDVDLGKAKQQVAAHFETTPQTA
jgi:uncharacterized protein (DUF697 family)